MPQLSHAVRPAPAALRALEESAFVCTSSPQGVGAIWVQAYGELDIAGAPQLESALRLALTSAQLVVLDLRELSFIDAAGVHVIIDASVDALLEGRRLVVAFAQPRVADVFEMAGAAGVVELGVALLPPQVAPC